MQKLDEQLQLLRQATPLLRQRAQQLTDAQAAEVREQLALVLDQQTDQFEESMKVRLDIVELYSQMCSSSLLTLPGMLMRCRRRNEVLLSSRADMECLLK